MQCAPFGPVGELSSKWPSGNIPRIGRAVFAAAGCEWPDHRFNYGLSKFVQIETFRCLFQEAVMGAAGHFHNRDGGTGRFPVRKEPPLDHPVEVGPTCPFATKAWAERVVGRSRCLPVADSQERVGAQGEIVFRRC